MSDGLANISELARLFNLHRDTVTAKIKGVEPAEQKGYKGGKMYRISDVAPLLTDSTNNTSEEVAKARRANADADKAELMVKRLRGELVPVADMKDAVHQLVKSLFQRCVTVAPRQLSRKLIGKTEPGEVEVIMREYYAGIFEELRALPTNFLNDMPPADEDDDDVLGSGN
jgi:hypothetical protein